MHSDSPAHAPLTPADLARQIVDNVERVIVGKRATVEMALAAMIAGGHVLFEDVPGLGKTMLARALAVSLGLSFKRIQFTADLMPADITGGPVYNPKDGNFELRQGPVFAHVVLADEINRANPRAQSALLECMEEGQVTIDGRTQVLPDPFVVLATQNPIDMAGTYPLPEAQLDRVLVRLAMGYPGAAEESAMIATQQYAHPISSLRPVCSPSEWLAIRQSAQNVRLSEELAVFVAHIVRATRTHRQVRFGASPRGTLGLARMTRALSVIRGRDYVDPSVVRECAPFVLAHRLVLRAQDAAQTSPQKVLEDILATAPTPR